MPGQRSPGETGLYCPPGDWPNLRRVAQVSYEREAGVAAPEQRYYICSRPLSAADFLQSVREHWGIANRRHWVLAVAFAADNCRGRADNAADNLSVVRQLALNRLRREPSRKAVLRTKGKRVGWDGDCLRKILAG